MTMTSDTMSVSFHTISIEGHRARNEDAVLCTSARAGDRRVTLIAVADGMGGSDGGEEASRIAVEELRTAWDAFTSSSDGPGDAQAYRAFLRKTYAAANEAVGAKSQSDPSLAEMGTTLVAAIISDARAIVANVGDSRAYLVAQDLVEQVTQDHSAVAESIREGIITEVEARTSPYRHALTRSIDGSSKLEVDLFPATGGWMDTPADSIMLLCSDGLTGSVGDAIVYESEIYDYLLEMANLKDSSEKLVALALQRGSRDNISIATAETGHVERQTGSLPEEALATSHESAGSERTERSDGQGRDTQMLAIAAGLCVLLVGLMGTLVWHLGARSEHFGAGSGPAMTARTPATQAVNDPKVVREPSSSRSSASPKRTYATSPPGPSFARRAFTVGDGSTEEDSRTRKEVASPPGSVALGSAVLGSAAARRAESLMGPVSAEIIMEEHASFLPFSWTFQLPEYASGATERFPPLRSYAPDSTPNNEQP